MEAPKVEAAPAKAVEPAEPVARLPSGQARAADASDPAAAARPGADRSRAAGAGHEQNSVEASAGASRRRPEDDLPGWPLEREETAEFAPISVIEPDAIHHEPEHDSGEDHDHPEDSLSEPVLERISSSGSRDFDWGE